MIKINQRYQLKNYYVVEVINIFKKNFEVRFIQSEVYWWKVGDQKVFTNDMLDEFTYLPNQERP